MSRRPGGAQSAPSWQRSILAVNLFLLARGGVAAGLVVQATRNNTTDSEQEEGDGQHWRRGVRASQLPSRLRARRPRPRITSCAGLRPVCRNI